MARKPAKPPRNNKKLALAALCVVALIGLAYVLVIKPGQSKSSRTEPPLSPIKQEDINFEPPTASEQANSDANKEKVSEQLSQEQQPPTSTQKTVKPIITSPVPQPNSNPSDLRISAYIPEVFEDGGTCVATLQGSTTIKLTSKSFKNASTTDCVPMNSKLSAGTWSITVSYESSTAKGQSSSMTFKVE